MKLPAPSLLTAWLGALLVGSAVVSGAPGDPESGFDPVFIGVPTSPLPQGVFAIGLQQDGKIVIGGDFTAVDGVPRNYFARLNRDGSLDETFNPDVNRTVSSVTIQADSKILIVGSFSRVNGEERAGIARLNEDGTLDTTYNPVIDGSVALQRDGALLILRRGPPYLQRLLPDGTVDTSFNPGVERAVASVDVQLDGRILVYEYNDRFAPDRLFRLNADGTLDASFNAERVGRPGMVQSDGKAIIVSEQSLVRLNSDGSIDPGFFAKVIGYSGGNPHAFTQQSDGKIVIVGEFSAVNGVPAHRMARLNPDGSRDFSFEGAADLPIYSVLLQSDGRILIGGSFTELGIFTERGGVPKQWSARLINDPATQSLTVENSSRIQWLRGGASPELWFAEFELSTDDGASWTALGRGVRFSGGWELSGLTLPPSGLIRARSRIATAAMSGDSGWVVTTIPFGDGNAPELAVENADGVELLRDGVIEFGTAILGRALDQRFVIRNNDSGQLTGLAVSIDGPDASMFTLEENPVSPVGGNGGSTVFAVRFRATSVGQKTAGLRIVTSDPGAVPFDISLLGIGRAVRAGDLDDTFDAGVTGDNPAIWNREMPPYCTVLFGAALQPDGRLVIGGGFTHVDGSPRNCVARLNRNGTLDHSFASTADSWVTDARVQTDGKTLISGPFRSAGGVVRNGFARLNSDGMTDLSFDPPILGGRAGDIMVQPDRKLLVTGSFTSAGGFTRNGIARFDFDGTVDSNFAPVVEGAVWEAMLQPDGKAIIAGPFTSVSGVPRAWIARLGPEGAVDAEFNVAVDGYVYCMAQQRDGRVLISGSFAHVNGIPWPNVARLNPDGSLDESFSVVTHPVSSIAVQCDGAILISGTFASVNGAPQKNLARLHPDGALDASFNVVVNDWIEALLLQPDGKIVIAGYFSKVNGVRRQQVARLENDPAISRVSARDRTQLEWVRGGAAPEVHRVTFELSHDAGASWSPLGNGLRTATGWECTGLNLPPNGLVRARGFIMAGGNSNSGFVEETISFTVLTPFAQWKLDQLGDSAAANDGDPERDGLANILEYATGGDPLAANALPGAVFAGGRIGFEFSRDTSVGDVTLIVQASDDLVSWTDLARSVNGAEMTPLVAGVEVTEAGPSSIRAVQVLDLYDIGNPAHPQRFFRLRAAPN